MKDEYEPYRIYLQPERRIEIGIPLAGGGVFRDWAIILETAGDKLLMQISRDVLPANVRIDVGFILDVSVTIKEDVYTCSAIVSDKLAARVLWVQLFGTFTLRERRQFFRMDIPLKIQYAISTDESWNEIEADWELRKALEHIKFQGFDEFTMAAERARYGRPRDREWRLLLKTEVNLGGGGIGIRLPEPVQIDQFICVIVHLPLIPPREVQAVAQVLMVQPPEKKGRRTVYEAGMQFVCLDDKDRERIFQHISVSQIEYLRETADRREPIAIGSEELTPAERMRIRVRQALWTALFLVVAAYLVKYFIYYEKVHPANEIGKTYEKALKQYRHIED